MTTPESTAAATAATASREAGPWRRRVGGLHVLKVTGSPYDMGHQHGSLLRDAVREGPLPYYRTYVERLLGGTAIGGALGFRLINRLLGKRIEKGMPPFAIETLRGLAEGAELPLEEVMAGATMPDALVWLVNRLCQLKAGPAVAHRAALGLGCTSAIAWGDATADGRLLHARNLDYHGVEAWPKTAAVVFHEPEEGLRYVSVAAAGVPLGGVTAMNEAGLTLTVHQHMFTDGAKLGGMPIGLVGDVVMRTATSLDEAEAILAAHTPIGCWTYLIADGGRGEVLCWEENPARQVGRRLDPTEGTFGYANVYLDEELGRTERHLYGSYWRHNAARHRRANALLEEGRGRLGPADMAGILADTGEGDGCRLHEAIAMLMTVGSVVFRPEDGTLWVGTGESPTSHGEWQAFSLEREGPAPDAEPVVAGPGPGPAAEAFERYRRAYLAYVDRDEREAARALIEEARGLQPGQPLYHVLGGLLALRAGEPEPAEAAFDQALALGHPTPERRATFHLWRARARDLTGRRAEARTDYQAALDLPGDPPVHAAAGKGLRRPYRPRQAAKLGFDFTYADTPQP